MNYTPGTSTPSGPADMVVLVGPVRRNALREQCRGLDCAVMVTCDAYAAAVELLRGGAAVLVVDMACDAGSRAGLMAMASAQGAAVLGLGRDDEIGAVYGRWVAAEGGSQAATTDGSAVGGGQNPADTGNVLTHEELTALLKRQA